MFQFVVRVVVHATLALAVVASINSHAAELPSMPSSPQPKGSLVIIGGALRDDNDAVWTRIVQLAGGKNARIAVFASASASPERAGNYLIERLDQHGASAFFVPVAERLDGSDVRAAAEDPALVEAVRSAGGAYFSGGDQARITNALRRPDGSNTQLLDALWDMYRRGGVIAGSSAGAAIMSATMFGHPRSVLGTLQHGVADGRQITRGLGFIGDDVFIDQHLLVRGRFARMLPAMLAKGYNIGLGIDENTAMVVGPKRDVEVLGYRGALLVDLSNAATRDGTFNLSNGRLSYLDNGDRFNLDSKVFTPAPEKVRGKLDANKPYWRGPLFSADILGNGTVVDLMSKLVDSDQPDAIGLSLDSPNADRPDLGFEFRLGRVSETVGYQSAYSEAYSVYNVRLDIRPIVVQRPLYQYR